MPSGSNITVVCTPTSGGTLPPEGFLLQLYASSFRQGCNSEQEDFVTTVSPAPVPTLTLTAPAGPASLCPTTSRATFLFARTVDPANATLAPTVVTSSGTGVTCTVANATAPGKRKGWWQPYSEAVLLLRGVACCRHIAAPPAWG